MINLSIITVSYHSENFIEKYLNSVLKHTSEDTEVIILDSGSKDNTVSVIQDYVKGSKDKKRITLIESKENVGFGKGNNLASKKAQGKYLLFLNPDTQLQESIEPLVSFYKDTPDIGLVAPKLIMSDGKVQPSVKKLSTVWGAFREYVLGISHSYSEYVPNTETPIEVESVYGAAMLVSKELFEKVGGFDEKYFLYYEDMDFCKRIKKLGKKIFYFPEVMVEHLVGAAKAGEDRYMLNKKAAALYHGALGAFLLELIFLVPRLRRRFNLS